MKRSIINLLSCLAFSTFASPVLANDCNQAQTLFKEGLAAGKNNNWEQATQLLEQSTQLCNKFDNWYLLGQAAFSGAQYDKAANAFIEARKYAQNDDQIALSLARYAEVKHAQGNYSEASSILHDAKKLHSAAPVWFTDLALKVDSELAKQPITVASITRAFTELPPKSFHKYQPEFALRMSFKFDSDELINKETFEQSVPIIAEALQDPRLSDKTFTLIGHSDIQGDAGYNKGLSMKRAKMIREAITKVAPSLAERIELVGMGEKEPLYTGDTEQEHQLNRRVEISLNSTN